MRISVVTPNLNGAAYLEQTICSVLAAGERVELEHIVVDGGSTDASAEIIDRYRGRLAHVIRGRDGGQYDAIAKGLRAATGDIFAWLNSDDVYLPWALETVSSVMEALPDVEWLTTLAPGAMDADGLGIRFRAVPGYSAQAFADGLYLPFERHSYGAVQQESCFWRRSLWERAGARLDPGCTLAADFELWARFFRHAKLYAVESPLAIYRYRPGQRSSNAELYLDEARRVLQTCGGRSAALRCRLRSVPLMGPRYSGWKVMRAEGEWQIREYRFH